MYYPVVLKLIIFSSGKINIIGTKSKHDVCIAIEKMLPVLNTYHLTEAIVPTIMTEESGEISLDI